MQLNHVPSMGLRYWAAFTLVSIFGTNLGDFSSRNLHFGNALGLVPWAALLAVIFFVERRDRSLNQAYYWAALIVIRAAATNLADFVNQDLGLRTFKTSVILVTLLALALFWGRPLWSDAFKKTHEDKDPGAVPTSDGRYWTTMMIAATIGTVVGDFLSFGRVQFGTGYASIILGTILAVVFFIGSRGLLTGRGGLFATVSFYWITVVAARAAGTAIGDHLGVMFKGWGFGLPLCTLFTGLVCTVTIFVWKDKRLRRIGAS